MMESTGRKMNSSRLKMATVPQGASLIENSASLAPGFRLENVFVLAGVPHIARAMFAALESDLEGGAQILSASVDAHSPEGDISEALEQVALAHQLVEIGSYPYQRDGRYGANLVVRGTGPAAVQAALSAIETAMAQLGVETRRPQ
jgi:molybdopterin-biosynthesis enzyme MoeA-like protein